MTARERYWLAGGSKPVPHLSRAALQFGVEESRLLDFFVFVTNAQLVSLTEEIKRFSRAPTGEGPPDTDGAAKKLLPQPGESLPDPSLLEEMVLVRVVDSFLTYLSELLALIFEERPETLRSSEQERLDFILQFSDLSELRKALADKRVERLSFLSLRDFAKYLEEHLGFMLFENASDLEDAAYAVELRNLFVHNRGVINKGAIRRFPQLEPGLGKRIRVGWRELRERRQFLENVVLDIDVRATQKFRLATMPFANPDHSESRAADEQQGTA